MKNCLARSLPAIRPSLLDQANLWIIWIWLLVAVLPASLPADDLAMLRGQKDLTPESLLRFFAGFRFEAGEQVQDSATFLRRQRGDCDDFARLASSILPEHGYTTKLVVIMMEKQTHVVCYVKEAGGFLDFNHRTEPHPIVGSDGSLEDIADKVSAYFRSKWRIASEFQYQANTPVFLNSVFWSSTARVPADPVRDEHVLGTSTGNKTTGRAGLPAMLGTK
jgi:hypothetical protein